MVEKWCAMFVFSLSVRQLTVSSFEGVPCPYGEKCCWGHVCPNGPKCFHLSKGKCWFKGGKSTLSSSLSYLTYIILDQSLCILTFRLNVLSNFPMPYFIFCKCCVSFSSGAHYQVCLKALGSWRCSLRRVEGHRWIFDCFIMLCIVAIQLKDVL